MNDEPQKAKTQLKAGYKRGYFGKPGRGWWDYKGRRYPRTNFEAGTVTDDGRKLDLRTGELEALASRQAQALAAHLLEDGIVFDADSDKPKIVQCAWCHRIKQPDGTYAPGTPEHRNVSHGICPDCLAKQMSTLRRPPNAG